MKEMTIKELRRFFIYTFIGSWAVWAIAVTNSLGILRVDTANDILVKIGTYSPSIVGIILTLLYDGRKKLKLFLKRGVSMKFSLNLYAYMFLLMPCILLASYLFTKGLWGFNYELPLLEDPLLIVIVFFYLLFLGGPLGEEFGWRGFSLYLQH